jgi:hypothetical protein
MISSTRRHETRLDRRGDELVQAIDDAGYRKPTPNQMVFCAVQPPDARCYRRQDRCLRAPHAVLGRLHVVNRQ